MAEAEVDRQPVRLGMFNRQANSFSFSSQRMKWLKGELSRVSGTPRKTAGNTWGILTILPQSVGLVLGRIRHAPTGNAKQGKLIPPGQAEKETYCSHPSRPGPPQVHRMIRLPVEAI